VAEEPLGRKKPDERSERYMKNVGMEGMTGKTE